MRILSSISNISAVVPFKKLAISRFNMADCTVKKVSAGFFAKKIKRGGLKSCIALGVFSLGVSLNAFSMEKLEAVRLLQQGTFGPSETDVQRLSNMTAEEWVDEQLAVPASYHREEGRAYLRRPYERYREWFKIAFYGEDQLRQRMAFALSQIFVVSQVGTTLNKHQGGLLSYYDTLVKHGLGNYRDLMYDVTMHPVMGTFLTYVPNYAAPADSPQEADENYARELLQLMSLGIYQLNLDGTYKLKDGKRIENYTQEHIKAFAKVFTGLCYGDSRPNKTRPTCDERFGIYTMPLLHTTDKHDKTEKVLLPTSEYPDGQVLPANSGMSDSEFDEEIHAALDNIFANESIAPFVSQRLIKMLVTSNPSPEYVRDVATVFNDNGSGVKGDLAAVAKAILLHDEARNGHVNDKTTFGKVREPLLALTHFSRALDVWKNGAVPEYGFHHLENSLYSAPMMAPSVFNFYQFDYRHPLLSDASDQQDSTSVEEQHPHLGDIIRLQSEKFPGYYFRHNGNRSQLSIDNSTSNLEATQFKIVQGLSGQAGTISLESVDKPNHYLRHWGGKIMLDHNWGSDVYRGDASWRVRSDVSWIAQTADSDGITCVDKCALESVNFSNEFIRLQFPLIKRTPVRNIPDQQNSTFSFHLVSTPTVLPDSESEGVVSPVLGIYSEDAMLSGFNFSYFNIFRRPEAMAAYSRIINIIGDKSDQNIAAAVDYIDLMFASGEMSETFRDKATTHIKNRADMTKAVMDIMVLLFTSPDFMIQR